MRNPRTRLGGRIALALSAALYRLLVGLRYPRALRRRFGPEMEALFRAILVDEMERGTFRGMAIGWARIARDLAHGAPSGDTGGEETMKKARRSGSRTAAYVEDLGSAVRSLRREPRFAGLVVAVLAVGIALTVAVFAVVNAYLLRPLPYPAADRLVAVRGATAGGLSWDDVDEVFERAVSWDLDVFSLVGDGEPMLASGAWVTPSFLEVYDVRPALGRVFLDSEGGPGAAPVALVSHRLWQERFGGTPDVLGRTFRAYMSDRPESPEVFTIVGVLPSDFWYFNSYTDVLAPIREPRPVYTARLAPGVPPETAEEILTAMARSRSAELPEGFAVELAYLHEQHVAQVRPTLLVLQAAVLLVLLIACANAAVLFLVRAARREREFGVRRALGAPAVRLARQLLGEGLVVAGLAGVVGVLLAGVGLDVLGGLIEAQVGRSVPGGPGALRIDTTVVVAAAALTGLVGIVFGLVPLITSTGGRLADMLADGARGGTDSRGRQRLRSAMVVAEVALSLALLTGAGLMVRSAVHLQRQDLGFQPEGVARGVVGLRQGSYPEATDQIAFFDRLMEDVRALPEVESAGLTSTLPFTSRFATWPVGAEAAPGGESRASEAVRYVTGDGWIETMRISLVRGRGFSRDDVMGGEPVALVSESLAERLWPGEDPLGRRLRGLPDAMAGMDMGDEEPWLTVVGVVADIRRDVGLTPPGDLYTFFQQSPRLWMNVVARVRPGPGGPAGVLPDLEDAVQRLDADVPLSSPLMLEEAVNRALAPTRFLAVLLAGFSAFSLLLAVLGLYGVISYTARQRRRDVAIRIALGADRAEVTGLFLRQGLLVVGAGVVLGLGGGRLLGRALAGQLHGVTPGDPLTFAALALLLLGTAGAAVWLPARQAAGTDPMRVLREE